MITVECVSMANVRTRKLLFKEEQTLSGLPRILETTKDLSLLVSGPPMDSFSTVDFIQRLNNINEEEDFGELDSQQAIAVDEVADARKQAAEIISDAEKRALEFLIDEQKRAGEESERIIKEARSKAQREFDGIRKTAREDVYKSYEGAIVSLKLAAKSLHDYRNDHLSNAEKEIVALIGAIARKLLHRELSVSPACMADIVADSLKYFDAQALLIVKVSPENYHSISEDPLFLKRFNELGLSAKQIELISDAKVKTGTVVVTDRFVTYEHDFDCLLENVIKDALTRCDAEPAGEFLESPQEE
jgi:flagellar biosynthesis/type III secretory pathway protein FliH